LGTGAGFYLYTDASASDIKFELQRSLFLIEAFLRSLEPKPLPGSGVQCTSDGVALTLRESSLDGSIPIVGPYSGGLNDMTERIDLIRPDNASFGVAPDVIRDSVTYWDFRDWPTAPDGNGPSLERRNPSAPGDLATNWGAGPSGGTPGVQNSLSVRPVPSLQPAMLVVLVVVLSVLGLVTWRRAPARARSR